MKSFSKTTDELLLQATQRDVDEFFDHEKSYVLVFHEHIKEATQRADRMTRCRKSEFGGVCATSPLSLHWLQ